MTATAIQTVRVFVSSTWMDLQPERKAVEAALQRFRETKFVGMEYFGSRTEATSAASRAEVDRSDVCIVIVGDRYGSGITEQEYVRARERKLPCFVYVKEGSESSGSTGEDRQRRDDFVAGLRRHTVTEFDSPENLAAKVAADLHRWLFDDYLIPRFERALHAEAGRAEIEALLAAVRDMASLGKELLERLRQAGATSPPVEVKIVLTAAEVEERANLAILRDRVKQWWISGILEQSVHGEMLLHLGKTSVPDAIDHPWHAVFELADHPPMTPAPGTRTVDLFAQAGGFLLILGEPGGGKTIMLLELARDLITASAADPSKPVPIVLNLSSWGSRRLPLRDWIAEELKVRYYVAPSTAATWLARGRLVLLLDGMDEVAAEHRPGCVDAINHFVRETPPPGLAVCVRREEHSRIDVKLTLQAAVYIQPLTIEQADAYLAATGRELGGLRAALRRDAAMQEMAQSPLMLSILVLTYRESSPAEMPRGGVDTLEARRDQVFGAYVGRMFERRGKAAGFDQASAMRALSWLARQMQRHSQTIVTLEQLQPTWCVSRSERWAYLVATRAVAALAIALSIEIITVGAFGWWPVLGALAVAVVIACVDYGYLIGRRRSSPSSPRVDFWMYWAALLIGNTAVFVVLVLLTSGWRDVEAGFFLTLVTAPLVIITYGRRIRSWTINDDIQVADVVRWSWRSAWRGSLIGAGFGAVGGYLAMVLLIIGLRSQASLRYRASLWEIMTLDAGAGLEIAAIWIGCALLGALLGGLLTGLGGVAIAERSMPNQGIRTIARRSVASAAVGVTLAFSLAVVWPILKGGQVGGGHELLVLLRFSASIALGLAPAVLLWFGGFDVVKHYVLRAILWVTSSGPRRWVAFLDFSARLVILRKVGGGYVFTHRLLLDYFASLSTPTRRSENA